MRKPTAERGEACQWRTASVDRQHGFASRQRLADDPGEEARGRLVRQARANRDRRQANSDPVEKAAPRIIREQQFADRLLRAIARERRREELVADRFGKRRAENRDRRGEDEPRPIGAARGDVLAANRLEDHPGAVEIDGVALFKVRFSFARYDRGEQKDYVRTPRDQLRRNIRRRDVAGFGGDRKRRRERRGRDDVDAVRGLDPSCLRARPREPAAP